MSQRTPWYGRLSAEELRPPSSSPTDAKAALISVVCAFEARRRSHETIVIAETRETRSH